ncbi:hypothetical protein LCGC14_2213280, partial [marine sediment metagenome]
MVDNDPNKANFLYGPSADPVVTNYIDDGIFTKAGSNKFNFNYDYNFNTGSISYDLEENHVYDFNYLRLDTSSTSNQFVQDGKMTIRIFLEGYDGQKAFIENSTFFIRQLQCIVFSDKNNLNSDKWDVSGNGYTRKAVDGGLLLNSGTITLNDDSNPTKTDITSDKIYRASIKIKQTDDTISFSIGDSGVYDYNHNTKSFKPGINSIEFTYDPINLWNFYVNGWNGTG